MIEAYYNKLCEFLATNILHYQTKNNIKVIIGGADPDLESRTFPKIVVQKLVDYSIETTDVRYSPTKITENIYDEQSGALRKLLVSERPLPVSIMSTIELWTTDTLEDLYYTASFLTLVRDKRFLLTVPFAYDQKEYRVIVEVSNGTDLSTKGSSGIRQDRTYATPVDRQSFRKVWTVQSTILLAPRDTVSVSANPVTTYEQDVDLLDGSIMDIEITENYK